jgi:very-short-patch-repair endonuclease
MKGGGEKVSAAEIRAFLESLAFDEQDQAMERVAPPLPAEEVERRRVALERVRRVEAHRAAADASIAEAHERVAGSPIETALLPHLANGAHPLPDATGLRNVALCQLGRWTIHAQYEIGPYIADLAVTSPIGNVVVECDGHDFHERTREQAAHDKRRDRYMQAAGWRVLRFTGSEIHRDAARCADEIRAFLRGLEVA